MATAINTTRLRKLKTTMWVLFCLLCLQAPLIPNISGPGTTAMSGARLNGPLAGAIEASRETEIAAPARSRTSLARLPLHFEENRGQAEDRFNFTSRAGGYTLLLAQGEATLVLTDFQRSDLGLPDKKSDGSSAVPERPQSQVRNTKQSVLRMKIIGANTSARIVGLDPMAVKSSYFIGKDPRKWRTEVPSYARVKYEDVYPGIDLVFYGNQRQSEYDFIVAPGAAPEVIRLNGEVSEPFLFAPGGPGIASRGLPIEESRVAGLHACLPFVEIRRFEARYWQSWVGRLAQKLSGEPQLPRLSSSKALVL